MSDIRDWDRDAVNNQDPAPDGFPEGMAPGAVNNSSREVMAAVRRQTEMAEWFDWGHEITYVSATSFTVPGDVTSIYHVGRRVWATMPIGGSLYGRVTDSTFVTSTTVEVVWDSGDLLLESGITMAVAVLTTVNTSLPMDWIAGQLGLQDSDIMAFESKTFWENLVDSMNPVGSVKMWPATDTSSLVGTWLVCDGAAVSQTTYADLFALIGHTFGADPGGGDFILPDLRGRSVFGHDAGGAAGRLTGYREGVNADTIGNAGGEEAHTQQVDELVSHDHPYTRYDITGMGGAGSNPGFWRNTETVDTGNIGGGQPMNTVPPAAIMNYIIRAL